MKAQAANDVATDGLTDEQRSAVKQNSNPVVSSGLRLSDADMQWWRDAKVGMFIHWGLYAIPAEGEWVMHNKPIPAAEYAKLTQQFAAAKFNADEWARAATAGGIRYVVFTARHHDGFALWDSKASFQNYTSMNAACHRDFIADYTRALRKAGLRVGIYYSPMDWRFPGYFHPKEQPDNALLMKKQCYGQIEELMSNYGQIDVLWYDGAWLAHQGSDADAAWLWDPIKLNTMVRHLQPKVVISPRSGWEGDFRSDEEGEFAITGKIRPFSWEKNLRIGSSWGYSKDRSTQSFNQLITQIVNAVTRNANILMNVSPDPDGVIPSEQAQRLAEVGQWLKQYGQSIYSTRSGPFQPVDGVYGTTYRDNRIYVHVLKWPAGRLELPALPGKLVSYRLLTPGQVTVTPLDDKTLLTPAAGDNWPVDSIVELELDRAVQF